jgi:hypothetical protein
MKTLDLEVATTLFGPPTPSEQHLLDLLSAPSVAFQYAIKLPTGQWWRKVSTRLLAPNHHTPTVYYSREIAADEMFDVTNQAIDDFGALPEYYRPQLMVREVTVQFNGEITYSQWSPVKNSAV